VGTFVLQSCSLSSFRSAFSENLSTQAETYRRVGVSGFCPAGAGVEGYVLDITQESAVKDFFSSIGEFDHLAVTAGESLDFGAFLDVDPSHEALPVGVARRLKRSHR
jgi:hypothetical protein